MNLFNLFFKKNVSFQSWETFQNKENFRENLIFQQKTRKDNIKNLGGF